MLYAAEPEGALLAAPLGEVTALYHRRSGATHLVVEPLPAILAALADGPCDAAALEARLAETFELDGERAALLARLEELVALGLVARIQER